MSKSREESLQPVADDAGLSEVGESEVAAAAAWGDWAGQTAAMGPVMEWGKG